MAVPAPDLGTIHHVAHFVRTQAMPMDSLVHTWHVLSLHRASGSYVLGDEVAQVAGATLILLPGGDRDHCRLIGRDEFWLCQFAGAAVSGARGGARFALGGEMIRRSRARRLGPAEERTASTWFRELLAGWRQGTPVAGLRTRARLLDLLTLWAGPAPEDAHADAAERLRTAIEAQACDPLLPLSVLSRSAGGDADAVAVSFRRRFGHTPVAYRTRQRLLRACELLVHDPRPLAEIARICGFSDAGYFCRVFRQHLGVSPRTYARQCGAPGG